MFSTTGLESSSFRLTESSWTVTLIPYSGGGDGWGGWPSPLRGGGGGGGGNGGGGVGGGGRPAGGEPVRSGGRGRGGNRGQRRGGRCPPAGARAPAGVKGRRQRARGGDGNEGGFVHAHRPRGMKGGRTANTGV